jgi:OmpA family
MYIRTKVDDFLGYGLSPAGVKGAVEIGAAVLSFGRDLFRGGSFSTTSSVVNYMHENTSPDRKFTYCAKRLRINATKPPPFPISLDFIKQKNLGEKFWFELSYEYNGNDLRNVAIRPLIDQSSDLSKSEFTITFAGNAYSLPRDPIAEVVFRISGSWKAWDPVPFMDTIVSFSGDLFVRADGSARIGNFSSEKGLVWFVSLGNSCPIVAPYAPQAPVRKSLSLPILFPFNKHKVSEIDVRRLHDWVKSWPSTIREKIARGEVMVTIEGFASRPGEGLYNLRLSERRAENVKNILRKFTGSNTRFDVRSHGAYSQNLPGIFDVTQWLKRFFDPNKYDQAAVIRVEEAE